MRKAKTNWQKRSAALTLVFCMVLSLFNGMTVYAGEGESEGTQEQTVESDQTGLVGRWAHDGDAHGLYINSDRSADDYFKKVVMNPKESSKFQLALRSLKEETAEDEAVYEISVLPKDAQLTLQKKVTDSDDSEDQWEKTTEGSITLCEPLQESDNRDTEEGNDSNDVELSAASDTEETDTEDVTRIYDSFYKVYFQAGASGEYRICYTDGENESYVTVWVNDPDAGFYTAGVMSSDNFIDEQNFAYSESAREFYFIYKTSKDDGDRKISVDKDGNVITYNWNDDGTLGEESIDGVTITKVEDESDDTENTAVEIYKITLDDAFTGNGFHLGVSSDTTEIDYYYIDFTQKLEGLVYTWSFDGDTYELSENPEYSKTVYDMPVLDTWTSYFGFYNEKEEVEAITEAPTIEKLEDGAWVDGSDAGTISQVVVGGDEESKEEVKTGFYNYSFNSEGSYRLVYNKSYITVKVSALSGGYFSTSVKDMDHYLERNNGGTQQFGYTASDRTFYFIYDTESNSRALATEEDKGIQYEYNEETKRDDITVEHDVDITRDKEHSTDSYDVYQITVGDFVDDISISLHVNFLDEDGNLKYDEDGNQQYESYWIRIYPKQEGLVGAWDFDWNDDGPALKENSEYSKSISTDAKQDCTYYFGTWDAETGTAAAVDKTPVIKDATGENLVLAEVATITPYEIEVEGENGTTQKVLSGFYHVNFYEEGIYRIYNASGDSYVTMTVNLAEAGFFSAKEKTVANYIDEQNYEHTLSGDDVSFYFIYDTSRDYCKRGIATDESDNVLTYQWDDEQKENVPVTLDDVSVEKENISAADNNYEVYKVTVGSDFAGDCITLRVNSLKEDGSQYTDEEGYPQYDEYTIRINSKQEGLVVTEDFDEKKGLYDGAYFTKRIERQRMYMGTIYLGAYNEKQEVVALPLVANPVLEMLDETTGKYSAVTDDSVLRKNTDLALGVYDLMLNSMGTYRINYGGSYILIQTRDIEAGFYSADEMTDANYLPRTTDGWAQKLAYDNTTRTFYFIHANKDCYGATLSIGLDLTEENCYSNWGNISKGAYGVKIEKVSSDDNYTVYEIKLGNYFSKDELYAEVTYTPKDGEPYQQGYSIELFEKLEGLVVAWPDWVDQTKDEENPKDIDMPYFDRQPKASSFTKDTGFYYDSGWTLYFGICDEDGNITPVRNLSEINVPAGAKLKKASNAVAGFYRVTFDTDDVVYEFTLADDTDESHTAVRIGKWGQIVRFYASANTAEDNITSLNITTAADGTKNNELYLYCQATDDVNERGGFENIIGRYKYDENGRMLFTYSNVNTTNPTLTYGFQGNVTEDASPYTIEPVTDQDLPAGSLLYKITIKDNAPSDFDLRIKAEIASDPEKYEDSWTEESYIHVSRVTTKTDESSSFSVQSEDDSKAEYVTIDEMPELDSLTVDESEAGSESGLTTEQQDALENGGELEISIKADSLKDADDNLTVSDSDGNKISVATDANGNDIYTTANGTTVETDSAGNVVLKHTDGTVETVNDSEKANQLKQVVEKAVETKKAVNAIEEKTKGMDKAYLDLSVSTSVKTTNSVLTQSITKTRQPMTIKVPLPSNLKAQKYFFIVRYHGGKIEYLKATILEENGKKYLTFETNRFSTYAIATREENDTDKLDFSKLKWSVKSSTLVENGAEQTAVTLTGLPDGCEATLTGNKGTDAGEYVAKVDSITYNDTSYQLAELSGVPDAITSGFTWAIVGDEQTEPENPSVPDTPGSTDTPGNTDTPGTTETPESTETPGSTDSSGSTETPGTTDTPGTTETPGSTETPGITDIPATTEKPDNSATTGTSTDGQKKTVTNSTKKGDIVTVSGNQYQVTSISKSKKTVVFMACKKNARTVKIPATIKIKGVSYQVVAIGANAFKGNKRLTTVTISAKVTMIGKDAFKNCTSLKNVTIPKNVKQIGANAFYGCKKLKTMTIKSTKLTTKTVAKNAFKGLTKTTKLKVPKNKVSAYKKLFKSKGLSAKIKVS